VGQPAGGALPGRGEAAFEPRSRRPKTSPTATSTNTVELIIRLRKQLSEQGLDAGPDTIAWPLRQHHQLAVSRATISRYLTAHGLVTPQPKKRPRSSYVRFQAALPNQTWQADFTHYRLADATDAEILTWLDDHSRYALHVSAWPRVTGPIARDTFGAAVAAHGTPASTLTDNAMVFTTRLAGGKGGRNALEAELRRLHVAQKNASPNHPTTCGKVERFQQTMKNWLRAQPNQPATITDLQALLDQFTATYNHQRAAPVPAPPRHPRGRLPRPPQSPPGHQPRPRRPHPRPPRPHRLLRRGHLARGRPPPPRRRRTNPRPNPRRHARRRPPPPHRQRRHRGAPPRTDHRPQPRLPTHWPPTRPATHTTLNPT
jgi:Integrase core domain